MTSAQEVVTALQGASLTVATAESLTGGLLCAALTDVPGASTVVRGAVVAYATEVKSSVLGVDAQVLRSGGAVQGVVATQMATGAARALGSDLGVATTGVAGPDPQDGQPVGTVFVAVSLAGRREVRRLRLAGSRAQIRSATVQAALGLVAEVLGVQEDPELPGR
ncbi:CinA family protein [Pedococcus sp. 5OH_020]|uniref:CinA family protein n=1 Tax=Pedococcus sp. 5OH_020 TaxID=2989814 RepID=UPI0022E9EAFF|nr:nicotinamide-nucleotide amidohydrolase family protein [Pedococcus sp. 5OH_020]